MAAQRRDDSSTPSPVPTDEVEMEVDGADAAASGRGTTERPAATGKSGGGRNAPPVIFPAEGFPEKKRRRAGRVEPGPDGGTVPGPGGPAGLWDMKAMSLELQKAWQDAAVSDAENERLRAELWRTAQENQRALDELHELRASERKLRAKLAAQDRAAQQPLQPAVPPQRPKLPRLTAEFAGEADNLGAFVWTARGFFADRGADFPDEAARVRALVAQLRGPAAVWAMSLVEAGDQAAAAVGPLLTALEARFRDPALHRNVWRQLKALRQGHKPVAAYIEDFRRLAAFARDTPPQMLVEAFQDGLSTEVLRWCLQGAEPAGLEDWLERAVEAEAKLNVLKDRQTGPGKKPAQGKPPKKPPAAGADEERQRRFREGLCLKCGRPGHRAADCGSQPTPPVPKPSKPKSKPGPAKGRMGKVAVEGDGDRASSEEETCEAGAADHQPPENFSGPE